jgi:hypothetical protein
MQREDPAEAVEGEIVGRPTMLAKFTGKQDTQAVLDALGQIGYPVEDVSVLFRPEGSDQVIDQETGHVAAGQSLTEEEVASHREWRGQTVVLLHPLPEQAGAVQAALAKLGEVDIEYAGETHALGRPGGVERKDETVG